MAFKNTTKASSWVNIKMLLSPHMVKEISHN